MQVSSGVRNKCNFYYKNAKVMQWGLSFWAKSEHNGFAANNLSRYQPGSVLSMLEKSLLKIRIADVAINNRHS
jgi:hypothetical protein